jgi:hypothetical protein
MSHLLAKYLDYAQKGYNITITLSNPKEWADLVKEAQKHGYNANWGVLQIKGVEIRRG